MTYIKRILSVGLIGLAALALGACAQNSETLGSMSNADVATHATERSPVEELVVETLLNTTFTGTWYSFSGKYKNPRTVTFFKSFGGIRAKITETSPVGTHTVYSDNLQIRGAMVYFKTKTLKGSGWSRGIIHLVYDPEKSTLRLLGDTLSSNGGKRYTGYQELEGGVPENLVSALADITSSYSSRHNHLLRTWQGQWENPPNSNPIEIELYRRLDGSFGAKYSVTRLENDGVVQWSNTHVDFQEQNGSGHTSVFIERFRTNIFPNRGRRADVLRQDLLHLQKNTFEGPFQAKKKPGAEIFGVTGQVRVS